MGSKVSMLYIEAASSYHAGNYTCIATNKAGRANYTATLNVHGKMATDTNVPFWTCLLLVDVFKFYFFIGSNKFSSNVYYNFSSLNNIINS